MTLVEAWTYAWEHSMNSHNQFPNGDDKEIRNARSVFWPECEGDTLPGVSFENITAPNGNGDQGRLESVDSKYP